MKLRYLVCLALLVLPACAPSQSTGDVMKTVSASGKLTLNGTPLEFYQVMFFPTDGRPAAGITDAEGKFVLGTNITADGAMVGSHRVAVNWVGPPSTDPNEGVMEFSSPPPPTVEIDPKYTNPETSGLVVEVPDAGSEELKVELQ